MSSEKTNDVNNELVDKKVDHKAKAKVKDMTVGSPIKLIFGFSVPLLFGMLFQQFYNLVDTMIVGKTLGLDALAGVGSTGSVNFLIVGFCIGVCSGFGIPIAQQFGAKQFNELRRYLFNIYVLGVIFAVVMTTLSVIFCDGILVAMNTPDSIYKYAHSYILVILLGIPTVFLYNIVSSVIRALGDSKTPVYFLVFSAALNIVLDFIFIMWFKMGVAGAAWATNVSQLVSGVSCFIYTNKKYEIIKLKKQDKKMGSAYIKNLLLNGIPMGLQSSITAIGSVILQTAVNTLGASYVAAMTAGGKVFVFFCCPLNALGTTMATYAGQNVGAGKVKRITKGVISAIILGAIYSVISYVILYFFADKLSLLFVDASETEIIGNVQVFIMRTVTFFIAATVVNVTRFSIQGMGFSTLAILAGVFEMAARTFVALVLIPAFGYQGACLTHPTAWLSADLFLIPAFLYCRHRLNVKAKETHKESI